MKLAVDLFTLLVNELGSVSVIAVHEAVAVGDTSVTHQDHDLVDGLGVLRKIVPECSRVVSVCEVGGWVALLGVDEVRELRRVAEEEDGCVVSDKIPVSFVGLELHGEASRVSGAVVRT